MYSLFYPTVPFLVILKETVKLIIPSGQSFEYNTDAVGFSFKIQSVLILESSIWYDFHSSFNIQRRKPRNEGGALFSYCILYLVEQFFIISLPWNSYVEGLPFPMVETSSTNRSPGSWNWKLRQPLDHLWSLIYKLTEERVTELA